jgi:hypothetical protein
MQRVAVGLGIDRDRRDPHPPRGLDDPAGDLAAIGDQDALKLANVYLVDPTPFDDPIAKAAKWILGHLLTPPRPLFFAGFVLSHVNCCSTSPARWLTRKAESAFRLSAL